MTDVSHGRPLSTLPDDFDLLLRAIPEMASELESVEADIVTAVVPTIRTPSLTAPGRPHVLDAESAIYVYDTDEGDRVTR